MGGLPRCASVERRVRPVFVGPRHASGALGAVSAQLDLRPDSNKGETQDPRERERLSQNDHPAEEREDGREVVTQSEKSTSAYLISIKLTNTKPTEIRFCALLVEGISGVQFALS